MPVPLPSDADAVAALRDTALRDVERTMIQIVQTSISLIGFGFTIHAFLQNADASASLGVDIDQIARPHREHAVERRQRDGHAE